MTEIHPKEYSEKHSITEIHTGLPWWIRVCLPISASPNSRHQFYPWFGKIPRSTEQLSPWATTPESVLLEPVLRGERSHKKEERESCNRERSLLPSTRERLCKSSEDPAQSKINKRKKLYLKKR